MSAALSGAPRSTTRGSSTPTHRPARLARGPSLLTGSISGSATPSTSYGSFPPSDAQKVEAALAERLAEGSMGRNSGRMKGLKGERRWERSRERLLLPGSDGQQTEDVYDSDGDLGSAEETPLGEGMGRGAGEEEQDEAWYAGGSPNRTRRERRARDIQRRRSGVVEPEEGDKQWGVVKMELMARTWGRRGLFTIYAGVYLISTLTSLEGNTTPTIEPYFLSLLGEHSMLSSVVIVMSIAYAIGKPPMTKILDVFGRAEGICFAAILYSLGYLITAGATDVRVYVFARALSALGGQGIQLAQQIIVADTTTLSNRGLITSTVSLPWLLTTWIGPPLGALFQRQGPAGYRAAYAIFGILLPLVATVLFCTLWLEWNKIKRKALKEGRTPSTRDLGFGVATRASWMSSHHQHHQHHHHQFLHGSPRTGGAALPSTFRTSFESQHPYLSPTALDDASSPAIGDDFSTAQDRREASAFMAAAHELSKRKRWNKSTFEKATELWKELDMVGLASFALGTGMFLLPFTLGEKRWSDHGGYANAISLGMVYAVRIWLLVLSGFLILIFFGWYESRVASIPLLPPRLLKNRTIVSGSLMGFFHFVSQYCYESFFASFLQVARGHSPQDASYISQSYMFSACVAAILAGSLAKLTNRYKWIGVVGVLIHAAGVWLMMRTRDLNGSTFELVLSQIIGGVGGGFTTIAVQTGCQSVVGHQDVAISTAIFLTITQVGGAVGGSIAGAVWSSTLPSALHTHLPPSEHSHIPQIVASLPYALSFPLDSPIRLAINQAYVDVQRVLNWLALGVLVPGMVAMMSMKNVNLEKEDLGVGEGVVVLGRASFLAVEDDLSSISSASETSSLLGGTSERG
ncbi:hypothetical protein JCM11641_003307 [Rhodosporidiobolus odoratus]